MRTLIFALIPGLLLGCGGDETASATDGLSSASSSGSTGDSDPTSPGDPTGNPSGSPTSDPTAVTTTSSDPSSPTSPTTGPGPSTTVTSDPTSDPVTTTTESASDTSGDTETTDATTDTTTGGAGACGVDGPEVDADLVHDGEPAGCGVIEFTGQNQVPGAGPVYALDGCPCDSACLVPDPWTLTLDVPPEWSPGILPACPRIVVERQMGKGGCELIGVAIWDTKEPEGSPALYHAGSHLGTIAAVAGQIEAGTAVVDECECEDCCGVPTLLDLTFSGLKAMVVIAEGQSGVLGDMDLGYEIMNFQSHLSGICDDSPAVDWIARRLGKP